MVGKLHLCTLTHARSRSLSTPLSSAPSVSHHVTFSRFQLLPFPLIDRSHNGLYSSGATALAPALARLAFLEKLELM